MKKFLSVLIVAVIFVSFFTACEKKGDGYNLYFKSKQENKLTSEERFIDSNLSAKNIAKILISEMEKGPQSEKNERLLPKGTKLLSIAVKNNVALPTSRQLVRHDQLRLRGGQYELAVNPELYPVVARAREDPLARRHLVHVEITNCIRRLVVHVSIRAVRRRDIREEERLVVRDRAAPG